VNALPLVSVVVPSLNQGSYLAEALQSLVDQSYPALEVVIQDGGSSDGSVGVAQAFARRYPDVFRVFVEADEGQADALNRGFARTQGTIMAYLNADDTYLAGALHRVAGELDPACGRAVVMGRCLFVGDGQRYAGVEHPAEFSSHFHHLAVWLRGCNTVPQPSVFWHRSVWDRCGGFDCTQHHVLDYDLFCRFSRCFHFHRIDQVLSTYRLHPASKTAQRTEDALLAETIAVSRRYWGPWYRPLRWRCAASHWFYQRQRSERARHHARNAEQARRDGRRWRAVGGALRALAASPGLAAEHLWATAVTALAARLLEKLLVIGEGWSGRYADGWVGPWHRQQLRLPATAGQVRLTLVHHPQRRHRKVTVRFFVNGRRCRTVRLSRPGSTVVILDVLPWRGQEVLLELRSNSYFRPSTVAASDDVRRLSVVLERLEVA
jgi:glycosyltransferase involved in cell wall biosynthesis